MQRLDNLTGQGMISILLYFPSDVGTELLPFNQFFEARLINYG
ncbi:hypothetical protein [Nostoc sp. UHCC 0870]